VQRENVVELFREEESEQGIVRYFLWNDKEYSVVNERCFVDDCRTLLKAILQQAINDFVKLSNKELVKEEDKFDLMTAKGLLFDDAYYIHYGGMDINARDIVYFLTGQDPNMKLFREGVERLNDSKQKKRATKARKATKKLKARIDPD
jgi:hypothetical protein